MAIPFFTKEGIALAPSGGTFSNGVIAHPLQKAGVIPHLSNHPTGFAAFKGTGATVAHAIHLFSKGAGNEGSGHLS